jgi:hypothetical protein
MNIFLSFQDGFFTVYVVVPGYPRGGEILILVLGLNYQIEDSIIWPILRQYSMPTKSKPKIWPRQSISILLYEFRNIYFESGMSLISGSPIYDGESDFSSF